MLTLPRLRETLHYDPDTGCFTWKVVSGRGKLRPGDPAGCVDAKGYIGIKVDRTRYLAHRLAWFYVHGHMPGNQIDHRNGVRSDNRISNLREAALSDNRRNSAAHKDSRSKLKGAYLDRNRRGWQSSIQTNGKSVYLGRFRTALEAHQAYRRAAKLYHGEFAFNVRPPI